VQQIATHFRITVGRVEKRQLMVAGARQVATLIKWMLRNSPSERPSARDLLRSDLLPPTVADEAVSDLLRSLPDAPDMLERVVDAIFSLPGGTTQGAPSQEEPGAPASIQVCGGLLSDKVFKALRLFGGV